MIVDDAPGNLAFLSDALEDSGYRVLVATDGESALAQLRHALPDLILLDVVMPGIDGFETCRRLKLNPKTRNLPILFMTALGELDDLLRGFREGAVDYIVKPIRHEEVLARVSAHMERARGAERAERALVKSGLAVVAIDSVGSITWLTPTAAEWLAEIEDGDAPDLLTTLPASLRDWVLGRLNSPSPDTAVGDSLSLTRMGKRLTVSVAASRDRHEYLVLLRKTDRDWDLDTVRASLGLTLRETEVLMWIARGKTNRDVGQILGSSPRTVNKHLENIFTKLGVETRGAAVAVAMDRIQGY
jgi:CheY-like chemotaxis protein/DNA-binding CsgD family transcriptional regulator